MGYIPPAPPPSKPTPPPSRVLKTLRADIDQPWHRWFSYTACLTPFRIEVYDYLNNQRWSYAYIFGLRIASWNSSI